MDNPLGNAGKILYVSGLSPPLALIGLKLSATPSIIERVGISICVDNAAAPGLIVNENDADEDWPFASVNVTV